MTRSRPFIVGIAGGTASGKTTLASLLLEHTTPGTSAVICIDSYYRTQDDKPLEERARLNYDHPSSLDFEFLLHHLQELRSGKSVLVPEYDYALNTRSANQISVSPSKIIIVEGILSLYPADLRPLYDLKIFVETPDDLRLARRLERDIRDRGRTHESVLKQWNETVHPMHIAYCEPSKAFADMVLSGEQLDKEILETILNRCQHI